MPLADRTVYRCAACGTVYPRTVRETAEAAYLRHCEAAEGAHAALRAAYYDAHPGVLDAIEDDAEEGW